MLGDDHAAVDDPPQGAAATGPVEVAGELGCSQVGDRASNGGRLRGRSWTDPA